MVNVKTRHIIYHFGPKSAAEAKERAVELRSQGGNARTIDATNFSDIEEADKIEFVGDFPAETRAAIKAGYERIDKRVFTRELSMHNEDGTQAIDIPEQWTQMSFPEMQKLAASLSDETVRTQEAAMAIIEAELERREEKLRAELKSDDPAGGAGVPTGRKGDIEGTDGDDEELDLDHLDDMTKAQLIEYAEDNEVDLGDATKKADILEAIRAAAKKE